MGGGGEKWGGRSIQPGPVTLIAKKPAAEEETSLVNIEGIKATLFDGVGS